MHLPAPLLSVFLVFGAAQSPGVCETSDLAMNRQFNVDAGGTSATHFVYMYSSVGDVYLNGAYRASLVRGQAHNLGTAASGSYVSSNGAFQVMSVYHATTNGFNRPWIPESFATLSTVVPLESARPAVRILPVCPTSSRARPPLPANHESRCGFRLTCAYRRRRVRFSQRVRRLDVHRNRSVAA
jgi:hypothetical protein